MRNKQNEFKTSDSGAQKLKQQFNGAWKQTILSVGVALQREGLARAGLEKARDECERADAIQVAQKLRENDSTNLTDDEQGTVVALNSCTKPSFDFTLLEDGEVRAG